MSTGSLKVIKASAGSGKTYSLIKEYILLALQKGKPDSYQHILAITFTNAATAEMKERFISSLRKFSLPESNTDSMAIEICAALSISHQELMDRCRAMFLHVIHNYDLLSISTIDSFTQRLIRAFARDLKLSYDFTIETDLSKFIDQIVDRCFDELISDDELRKYLIQFATDALDEEKNWNPKEQLVAFAHALFHEESLAAFRQQAHLNLSDFTGIRSKIRARLYEYESYITNLASTAVALIERSDLTMKDFKHGGSGYINRLFDIVYKKSFEAPSPRFSQMITESDWQSKSEKNAATSSAIKDIQEELRQLMQAIHDKLSGESWTAYQLDKLVYNSIYRIGLFNRLQAFAEELKSENNTLTFSDFHQLISEIVKESDAPFIYERIGIRYQHILIDEFQDTSALQWSNTVPLIINTLSEGNTALLVGDAKQSIYRWRGGQASQFVNLPYIDESQNPHYPKDILTPHFTEHTLQSNFRSARRIVEFNNSLYAALRNRLPQIQTIYSDVEQIQTKKHNGYVEIHMINEEQDSDDDQTRFSSFILHAIEHSMAAGYRPCDITILTRRNKETQEIAHLLEQHHYSTQSKESFLLEHSPSVRAIIGFIGTSLYPQAKVYCIQTIEALAELDGRISTIEFSAQYILPKNSFDTSSLQSYLGQFFALSSYNHAHSPIEKLYALITAFKLKQDVYLEFLIELFRTRCLEGNLSLTDLMEYWEEQKNKLYIATATNEDAVQLMTVHKSKGLQFPVVIYPCYKQQNLPKEIWISLDNERYGLHKALLKPKKDMALIELEEEENASLIDDVNVCYVATTRAEDRLYMAIEKKGKSIDLNEHLLSILTNNFEDLKSSETLWVSGNAEERSSLPNSGRDAEQIPSIQFGPLRKNKLKSVFNHSEDIAFGEFIHKCLSMMKSQKDIELAVDHCIEPNVHSEAWRTKSIAYLHHLFENEMIRNWFAESVTSKNEMQLLTEDGKLLIPDRVVMYDNRVDVIDFKTGQPRPEHNDQVLKYASSIKKIYPLPVNSYLVYTELPEIISVSDQ